MSTQNGKPYRGHAYSPISLRNIIHVPVYRPLLCPPTTPVGIVAQRATLLVPQHS